MPETVPSPLRSRLLPQPTWARVALLLLILFALLRSVLWASVQPAWLAPDEDYHYLYINYLVEKGTVPDLSGPFYTGEIYRGALLTNQGRYLAGPYSVYQRSPHAVLRQLGGPMSERVPAPPSPRPVLHPPGYYLPAVAIDNLLWQKISVTRLTAIRYYSALLGAITVFFAWLLAAQVLARDWERLAAAALTATQTIMAFSAATITNDVAVAAVLTATLALLARMLRSPPRRRHGVALGLLLSVAVLVKATLLSLLIVSAAVLLIQRRLYPDARPELRRVVLWAAALPLVLAGWWYVYLVSVTHSILGARGSLTGVTASHAPGIAQVPHVAAEWIAQVYRSYWFDYLSGEVSATGVWFWLPAIGITITAAGFVLLVWRRRGDLWTPERPILRQVGLFTLVAILLFFPPFALDVYRGIRGLPFNTVQGRFLTPAYPGLAVIAVLALRELTRGRRVLFPAAVATLVAGAFVLYWHTWIVWTLERFYGPIAGHLGRLLHDATYAKPNFVTAGFLVALLAGAALSYGGAWALTAWSVFRAGRAES